MKKALFVLFVFISCYSNAQISDYNKNIKKVNFVLNEWYLNKGIETFGTAQTPVGYKKSYDELKKILDFYGLNIMDAEVDNSIFDKSVEGLKDFQNLSMSLKIEWSEINMVWRANKKFQINWMCGDVMNIILIQKITK
jgi:hypothetical protein